MKTGDRVRLKRAEAIARFPSSEQPAPWQWRTVPAGSEGIIEMKTFGDFGPRFGVRFADYGLLHFYPDQLLPA